MRPFVLAAALLALAHGAPARAEGDPDALLDPRLVEFFGARSLAIIRGATRVEALRFADRVDQAERAAGAERVARHVVVRTRARLDEELATAVREAVLDGHSYELPPVRLGEGEGAFESEKLCAFAAPAGFRFWREGAKGRAESTVVLLSFGCDELGLVLDAAQKRAALARAEERELGTLDMASGRNRFLRLARVAFPDDERLASLRESPKLHTMRLDFATALRAEAFRVTRGPLERDAFRHWRALPRIAQAANLYEIDGEVVPLSDAFVRRAAAVFRDEALYDVGPVRAGDGLATYCLRFVWLEPRKRTETSVDVLIAPQMGTVELGTLVTFDGWRTVRHVVDARYADERAVLALLREAFPSDRFEPVVPARD